MLSKLYIYLPIIFLLLLFSVFQSPTIVRTAAGYICILILSFLGALFLIKGQIKKRWPFLIQIMLLTFSALMFFVLLSNLIWRYVFGLLFIGILSFFLFNLYLLLYQPRLAQPYALEKMSSWLNFVISYWLLAGIGVYAGSDPLGGLFFLSFILVFILFFWLTYYSKSLEGPTARSAKANLLIISLVLGEIYLVMNFLPLGLYLNALIVSILYSIISNLWQKTLLKKLTLSMT